MTCYYRGNSLSGWLNYGVQKDFSQPIRVDLVNLGLVLIRGWRPDGQDPRLPPPR